MEYLLLIGGLVVLIFAGEFLVRGAVAIALKFNIPTLVIGMTIVSFGTSAPELLVSLKAALNQQPELAIGNVLGSNISNITLVLGLTTIILPITVKRTTVKLDWPIMMVATILFSLFVINANIDWYEGLIFVVGLIVFNLYMFSSAKKNKDAIETPEELETAKPSSLLLSSFFVIAGSFGLAFGASWLLRGAEQIALNFGVSEYVIGVTIVAFGTSVPELITSVMAALKKQTDISVGNLIGSNIFNLLAVLGITSLIKEIPVSEQVLKADVYWLLFISFLIFPLMIFRYEISRLKGLVLFGVYVTYIYFTIT